MDMSSNTTRNFYLVSSKRRRSKSNFSKHQNNYEPLHMWIKTLIGKIFSLYHLFACWKLIFRTYLEQKRIDFWNALPRMWIPIGQLPYIWDFWWFWCWFCLFSGCFCSFRRFWSPKYNTICYWWSQQYCSREWCSCSKCEEENYYFHCFFKCLRYSKFYYL